MKKRKTAATAEEEAPNGNGVHKEGEEKEEGSEAEGEEEAEGEDDEEETAGNGVASAKAEEPVKPVKAAAPSEEKPEAEAVAAGGDEED